jgi:hypothetical protein
MSGETTGDELISNQRPEEFLAAARRSLET